MNISKSFPLYNKTHCQTGQSTKNGNVLVFESEPSCTCYSQWCCNWNTNLYCKWLLIVLFIVLLVLFQLRLFDLLISFFTFLFSLRLFLFNFFFIFNNLFLSFWLLIKLCLFFFLLFFWLFRLNKNCGGRDFKNFKNWFPEIHRFLV